MNRLFDRLSELYPDPSIHHIKISFEIFDSACVLSYDIHSSMKYVYNLEISDHFALDREGLLYKAYEKNLIEYCEDQLLKKLSNSAVKE